nr:MAG TPA_asm: hypothetical protein [Caudoviricetes sp.]DAY67298.1 MAG TPA: hypothetical protein [Caudoviricetes sp.]
MSPCLAANTLTLAFAVCVSVVARYIRHEFSGNEV